ncbi:hypothetical protein J6590_023124 [Homalodisca vitripennis]|nr:hypothetical protein J6590_023124 [Homalodisca vitripennis]
MYSKETPPFHVAPESLLQEIEYCARDVPLAWWEHLPGGPKIKEYFDYTSLHGLKYFSEPGRSLSERSMVLKTPCVHILSIETTKQAQSWHRRYN